MEKRNLKFELISRVMAAGQIKYPLQYVKRILREFKNEIGTILSIDHESTESLNKALDEERFKLEFEKMTVNIELVRNRQTKYSTIKNIVMN